MIKKDISENQVKIVFLAVGSNLGEKNYNIQIVKSKLIENEINIIKTSGIYETLSWPNPCNPTFVNLILKVKTILSPSKLLHTCMKIEDEMGRKRRKKNDPRICDIDIIDYDQKKVNIKNLKLTIPHSEMHKRSFVLLPLYEIAKNWIHPKKKVNISQLLNSIEINDLRTVKQI